MRIKFWGTRGSIPVPGPKTFRYGGNTPCIEVWPDPDTLFIFDAGTGIRALGNHLLEKYKKTGKSINGNIFISHVHWDHIQGLPFFLPFYTLGNKFIVRGPTVEILSNALLYQMSDPYFPITPESFNSGVEYRNISEAKHKISGISITTHYLNHVGLRSTFGYRVDVNGKSFVYITDSEPYDVVREIKYHELADYSDKQLESFINKKSEEMVEFCRGADLLVHDTMFTEEEYQECKGWGHSSVEYAIRFSIKAGVKRLALFHHHHIHDDETMDHIVMKNYPELENSHLKMFAAADEMELIID